MNDMVIKRTNGSGGYGNVDIPAQQTNKLMIKKVITENPRDFIAQPNY